MSNPVPHLRRLGLFLLWLCPVGLLSAAPVNFDIPAQPAPAALQLFSQQSGMKVLYAAADLRDVRANVVKGAYEPVDAIAQLLSGTGFEATRTGKNNFVVKKATAPKTTGSIKGSLTLESGGAAVRITVVIQQTGQVTATDRNGNFGFPEVEAGRYMLALQADGYQPMHIENVHVRAGQDLTLSQETIRRSDGVTHMEPLVVQAEAIEQMEKVEVVDTKPKPFSDRNVDLPRTINDVQPYYIFDSQKIEESGTTSVEDFLKQRLTMDTTAQTNAQKSLYGRSGQSNLSTPGTAASASSSINLQGLGVDHTLILVNGRPMPGVTSFQGQFIIGTPSQPDVNGIPLSAIDRIEVLPSSAGAIYGVGAVGGVINIVLKKAYTGGDLSATYASTWDGHGPSRTVEGTYGRSFNQGKTQLFLSAQYADQSPIYFQDRLNLYNRGYTSILLRDPSFLGTFGLMAATPGTNNTPPIGTAPNFSASVAGTPLTFVGTGASFGSSFGTVPANYTASSPTALIPGQWNTQLPSTNQGPYGLLVPLGSYPRRKSFLMTLTHDVSDRLQIHVDYSYAENHAYQSLNNQGFNLSIAAGSPVNPFNQGLHVTFPLNYDFPSVSNSIGNSISLGGTLKLPREWVAHLDYQWAQSAFDYTNLTAANFAMYAFSPTFGTLNPSGVSDPNPTPYWNGYNPFSSTLANPFNIAPFLQQYFGTSRSTSNDLIFAASGPLFHLPWGKPVLSLRLEHNKSNQPNGNTVGLRPIGTPYLGLPDAMGYTYYSYATGQSTDSANAELDLPIFKTQLPLLRALDLQFNISTQHTVTQVGTPGYRLIPDYAYNATPAGTYILGPNTLGGIVLPVSSGVQPYRQEAKLSARTITGPALSYKPFEDVIIRGSVAGGYVPPTYAQLLPTNYLQVPTTSLITDPKQNGARYNITSYSLGGNPELKPMTSKSWDLGLVWQPHVGILKGVRADVEFTKTEQFNQIYDPGVQGYINLEGLFSGAVVRDPTTGSITTVYDKYINAAEAKQSSWTYTLSYTRETAIGSFDLSAAATIQEHNQRQLLANTNFLEYVGFPSAGGVAKTKGTATLRWARRNWVAAWTVVSYGNYYQSGASGDPGSYATQLETGVPYTLNTLYTLAQGSNVIPSQTYYNLYLSYSFRKGAFDAHSRWGRWADTLLSDVKVSLVVNNVFNTLPPLDAFYAPFYTSPYGDVLLRNYAVTLKKSF